MWYILPVGNREKRTGMKQFVRLSLIILFILHISLLQLSAADLEGINAKGGLLWIGNAGEDAAPNPLTTISGVSFPIRINDFFLFEPEARFFGYYYGMEYGRAVPVEKEFADWTFVIGMLLEPRAVFDFGVHPSLHIGGYAATALLARIPTRRWGNVNVGSIAGYQYQKMRFLYPEVGAYLDWRVPLKLASSEADAVNEGEFGDTGGEPPFRLQFLVDISVYFPLFHAWDGETAIPFYDQMMVSGTVGLRFFLPGDSGEDQASR